MRPTTTIQHAFTFPVSVASADIQLTYAQDGDVKLVKTEDDATISADGKTATFDLSQSDTAKISDYFKYVEVQAKIKTGTQVLATKIVSIPVYKILNTTQM